MNDPRDTLFLLVLGTILITAGITLVIALTGHRRYR